MPENRFYVPQKLTNGQILQLPTDENRHLVSVMRAHVGSQVELVNGLGGLAIAHVKEIKNKIAHLQIESVQFYPPPANTLILAQGLPTLNHLSFIIEKATELGADTIWLFPGEWSEKKEISDTQWIRIQALTIAALKQSGRFYLPCVEFRPSLKEWKLTSPLYFGGLSAFATPFNSLLKQKPPSSVIVAIGPEKGWSEKERSYLKNNATEVSLAKYILRTETAALAAVSLFHNWLNSS